MLSNMTTLPKWCDHKIEPFPSGFMFALARCVDCDATFVVSLSTSPYVRCSNKECGRIFCIVCSIKYGKKDDLVNDEGDDEEDDDEDEWGSDSDNEVMATTVVPS